MIKSSANYTDKKTLLPHQNVLLLQPQQTRMAVVTIEIVTTICIVTTTITVVTVTSKIFTPTISGLLWLY